MSSIGWNEDVRRAGFKAAAECAEQDCRTCKAKLKDGYERSTYEELHDKARGEWFVYNMLSTTNQLTTALAAADYLRDLRKSFRWQPVGIFNPKHFRSAAIETMKETIAELDPN